MSLALPATPIWLCFGLRDHFAQGLEVEQGCPQRAMGPPEVSPKTFTREEEKECLLDGECGGHRHWGSARNRPSSSDSSGVWGLEGHGVV